MTIGRRSGGLETRVSMERPQLLDLVTRLQGGDSAALEPFIQATQQAAYRLALSHLHDAQLSQDAVQDAYLAVYQNIGKLRDPNAFRTWFFRIITNCCRDLARKRKPEATLEAVAEQAAPASSPEDKLSVRQAFDELGEQDRTILTLREVCQCSYEEMASTLEVPVGTIKSRLAKARHRFLKVFMGGKS